MKAWKESLSRLCSLGDVSLLAVRWGVSGVVSRVSGFARGPGWSGRGVSPDALASV